MCTFSYSFLSGFLSFHFPCVFIYFPSSSIHPCCLLFSLFSLVFLFLLSLLVCLCCFNHVLFLPLVPSFLSLIWFLPHLSFFLTASTFPYILPLLSFFFVSFLLLSFLFYIPLSMSLFNHFLLFTILFFLHHSIIPPPVIFTALSLSLFALSHMFLSLFSLCSCLCFSLSPPLRPSLPLSSSSLSLVCCSVA